MIFFFLNVENKNSWWGKWWDCFWDWQHMQLRYDAGSLFFSYLWYFTVGFKCPHVAFYFDFFLKIISYGRLSSSTNQNSQLESCRSYFSAICRGCNMFEVNGKKLQCRWQIEVQFFNLILIQGEGSSDFT